MPRQTIAQLQAENIALLARLSALETSGPNLSVKGPAASGEGPGKRPSDTLAVSETRYRRLFETAHDGILILNATTGKITDVNPFMGNLLGYAREEMIGKSLWDLGPARDMPASKSAFQRLQSQEYIRYENLPLENKAGHRKQVEFVSNVYLVKGQRIIQCNVRDITARKNAEANIRQVNAELTLLVAELQRRDKEMQALSQMNDLLQACTTQAEVYQVVALMAVELFPGQSGQLAVMQTGGRYLETAARWGNAAQLEKVFELADCWAMRRGQVHVVLDPAAAVLCRHFVEAPTTGYLCAPLVVQGETLGVLCLLRSARPDTDVARQPPLAITAGEAIKLSLSNLKLRDRLHEQAVHDPLTGLFNRRHLDDSLARELHRAERGRLPLCLVMIDLDHFKLFNDDHGHGAGDALLCAVAGLLRDHLRDSDILCRYGGEEFLLVLPDSSVADTLARMGQIRTLVKSLQIRQGDQRLSSVTISVGIAGALEHGYTADTLLPAADHALFAAKRAGRDQVQVDPPPASA